MWRPGLPQKTVLWSAGLMTFVVGCSLFGNLDGISDGPSKSDASDGGNAIGSSCGVERVCARNAPPGWSLVVVSSEPGFQCPGEYDRDDGQHSESPTIVPSAECSCRCGASTGRASCTTGNGAIALGANAAVCEAIPAGQGQSIAATGACTRLVPKAEVGAHARATASAVKQAPCEATPESTLPSVATVRTRVCAMGAAPAVGSCEQGRVCVGAARPSAALCLMGKGEGLEECPAGWPTRRVLAPTFRDTRACTACACETEDRCDSSLQLYSDDDCGSDEFSLAADGRCHVVGEGAGSFESARYLAVVQAGAACKVATPSTPTGGLEPVDPRVVCCP
jgi:hypothetical protein